MIFSKNFGFLFIGLFFLYPSICEAKGWKFKSNSKKGLLVLVTKDVTKNSNLFFGMIAADPSTSRFLLNGNSFQTIVSSSSRPIKTPNTIDTPSQDIKFSRKTVRPGHYIIKSGYTDTPASAACYGNKAIMFDIKPGTINLVVLPDTEVDRGSQDISWALNPKLSNENLLSIFKSYTKEHKKLTAPIRVSEFEFVIFAPSRNKTMYPCGYPLSMDFKRSK